MVVGLVLIMEDETQAAARCRRSCGRVSLLYAGPGERISERSAAYTVQLQHAMLPALLQRFASYKGQTVVCVLYGLGTDKNSCRLLQSLH
jgi:hypothetical protein